MDTPRYTQLYLDSCVLWVAQSLLIAVTVIASLIASNPGSAINYSSCKRTCGLFRHASYEETDKQRRTFPTFLITIKLEIFQFLS